MAELRVFLSRIQDNILKLDRFFESRGLTWTLVLKVLGGHEGYWMPLLDPLPTLALRGIADSRLEHLEEIKEKRPEWVTWQIRPPALVHSNRIVAAVDVSCNSSVHTLIALNEASKKRGGVKHKVLLMVELGENREGFPPGELISVYPEILELKHLEIVGLGSNLGCLYGVEPTYAKLTELVSLQKSLSLIGGPPLSLLSGGSSINLPLIAKDQVPKAINHYRVGEAVFFGTSPYDNEVFEKLNADNFRFSATILEVHNKDPLPVGGLVPSALGTTLDSPEVTFAGVQALLDFGVVDVDPGDLRPVLDHLSVVGSTSDMTIIYDPTGNLHVGDKVEFIPSYMGVAKLVVSNTVRKVLEPAWTSEEVAVNSEL